MKSISIATASNENYAPGLLVTVASVLNTLDRQVAVTLYLFNGGLSQKALKRIEWMCHTLHPQCTLVNVPFDESVFAGVTLGPGNSFMAYTRLLLGSMLKVEKVIYIDSDVLAFKDMKEAWELDMQGKIALVCRDNSIPSLSYDCPWPLEEELQQAPYFNSGFIIIDLKQWRDKRCEAESLKLAKMSVCKFWDQTILNFVLRKDVAFINGDWNWQTDGDPFSEHGVLPNYHFVERRKPWFCYDSSLRFKLWRLYYRNFVGDPALHLVLRKEYRKTIAWHKDRLVQKHQSVRWFYALYLRLVHRQQLPKVIALTTCQFKMLGAVKNRVGVKRG